MPVFFCQVLNRSALSLKEKRDCELFYLKTFSCEYYKSGGKEDQEPDSLSQEFKEKHPTYLKLIKGTFSEFVFWANYGSISCNT